jgi:hypothetical protein
MITATRRRRWAIVIALGVLAGIGAVAHAAIPDSNGVIHGCYGKDGKLIVIDSATEQCKSGETTLDWSATGPQGPEGPQGPQGAQGPAGPSGPGLGSLSKLVTLNDNDAGHAAGWDPDGSQTFFNVSEPDQTQSSVVVATVHGGADTSAGDEAHCWADTYLDLRMHFQCNRAPKAGASLAYLLVNP